jgi:Domain of unknown function DUF29
MPTTAPLDAKAVATLYDTDLFAWANTNAELLRQGNYQQVDIGHLIEEIEDMGKSQQHAIASHLRNLLMHLLKWQYQSILQTNSWRLTIHNCREEIQTLIEESPSLKNLPDKLIPTIYPKSIRSAVLETGLPAASFPADCPYTVEQILADDWLPQ